MPRLRGGRQNKIEKAQTKLSERAVRDKQIVVSYYIYIYCDNIYSGAAQRTSPVTAHCRICKLLVCTHLMISESMGIHMWWMWHPPRGGIVGT